MKKVFRVFLLLVLFICTLSGTASAFEGTKTEENKIKVYFSEKGKETRAYYTSAITVEDFLLEINITLEEYDNIMPEYYELLTDNMTINYSKATAIYVCIDDAPGDTKKVMTQSIYLHEFAKEYGKQTGMEFAFDKSLVGQACKENMVINLYTKRSESFTTTKPIAYETQYHDSPEINEGVEEELIAGVMGELSTITRVDYIGKEEVSREIVAERVTIEPIDRVVLKGTAKIIEIVEVIETPLEEPEVVAVAVQQETPVIEEKTETVKPEIEKTETVKAKTVKTETEVLQYAKMLNMSATAYTADFESTGKRPGDKYFGITASGMKAQVGVVAVDPKVIPLGTRLYIEGYGYAIAGDTGGAIKGNKIDLYFDTNWECKVYGRQQIKVYILEDE